MKPEDHLVIITTSLGDIVIEADPSTPLTAANFLKLASEGFYNDTTFHRVIPNFMIQGGDPNSKSEDRSKHGTGGPGYTIPAEIKKPHARGTVATARLGDEVNPKKESSGSQFFINLVDNKFLNGNYTVFGKVIRGMEVVDKIAALPRDRRDNPLEKVSMAVRVVPRAEFA
jgi:cyclophilin family peptidyl-prolyl cis-trans isomerase